MQKNVPLIFLIILWSLQSGAQCDATFSYAPNQNQVSFTPAVTNANNKHTWFFGDGRSAYLVNPVHYYNQPGQYNILHTVTDSVTNCVDSIRQVIVVNFTPVCKVSFTYIKQSDLSNEYYFYLQFSTSGSALKTILWTINGVQVSSQQSFSYSFSRAGRYNVCVRIQATSGCTADYCDSISYQPYDSCNLGAAFTSVAHPAQPRTINFTASPDQNRLKYLWSFGDGSGGTGRAISHSYYYPGIYHVNLTLTDSSGHCMDSISQNIAVAAAPSETCTLSIIHISDSQGQVSFAAASNQVIVSHNWIITRMPDSIPVATFTVPNPVYTFTDSGYYLVCVAAVTNTGCRTFSCDSLLAGPGQPGGRVALTPSYPNPVYSSDVVRLNIEMPQAGMIRYTVCDLAGNTVYQFQKQGHKGTNGIIIPVQQLGKGQYFVEISFGNQQRRSRFHKL